MTSTVPLLFDGEVISLVSSEAHLKNSIERVVQKYKIPNPMFDLVFSDYIKMHLGYSAEFCWLYYLNEDIGYFLPKGRDIQGTTYFMYGLHHTEVLLRNCVVYQAAITACVEFLSGELPASVSWEHL